MLRITLSCLVAVALASPSRAQITSVGPFIGDQTEEFEAWQSSAPCYVGRIFGNRGDLCSPGMSSVFDTFNFNGVPAHNGSNGLVASVNGYLAYTFDAPAQRFGGYFASTGIVPDASAKFYDANNNLLATLPVSAPWGTAMAWNGWDAGAGAPFKRIEIWGNDHWNNYGLIPMDDMEVVFAGNCVSPSTYCTAKSNSQGCKPSIGFSGTPSATHASPFKITATNELNNKVGLLFYGHQVAGLAFQGGFLCVKPPITRTSLQNSGGSVNGTDCTGNYSYDFNAWIQSGSDPSLSVGAVVFAQFWARDPQDPTGFTTSLSNALVFAICP